VFERVALVHYHEIGLKGRNRSPFERRLAANLRSAVEGLTDKPPYRVASRLLVPITDRDRAEDLLAAVAATPGITTVSPAVVTARELDQIFRAAEFAIADFARAPERSTGKARPPHPPATFAVRTRRSSTDFPMPSGEVNIALGDHVRAATGMAVDLDEPDVTVHVEIVQGFAYVYARRIPGPGGLPSGTSGRVVSLLSAGIDSPVATWRVIKRGAVVVGVHFSGRPQTDERSVLHVQEIGEVLERTRGLARIHVVSFGDIQRTISLAAPPDLRVLLYRRMMVRVAEEIARREGARALVTGESLGQVASQTLENIAAVDDAATMPLLRPLIGMDKNEIMADARRIGTFDISTQAHDDCCTLFMPRMPATHASVEQVRAGEADLDVPGLVEQALATLERREFICPAYGKRSRTAAGEPAEDVDAPPDPAAS
jgi:thiamine biosynthesis protein ThiI